MLTGEGGILQNAREASDKTGRANAIEMAQLDVLEKQSSNEGKISDGQFIEILNRYFTDSEGNGITELKEDWPNLSLTTKDGKYSGILASEIYNGKFSGSTQSGSKKVDDLKNAKQLVETNTEVTSDDNVKVTVPAGFTIPEESPNTAIDGIIITDSIDETTGASTGNEFVWIPVNEDLTVVGTDDKFMAKVTLDQDDNGRTNYQGVLYEIDAGSYTHVPSDSTQWGQGTTAVREPDTVSSYDNNDNYLNIIKGILTGDEYNGKYDSMTTFKATMQEDYNEMIESVKTYGGFYVGRYEMGLEGSETKKAISKKGSATDATESKANTWYGLYAYGKTYENTNKTTKSSVKSSMIWGSQYDAMLNYALLGDDKGKVTATGNGYTGDSATNTGVTEKDKILNIFDLEGNHFEWTLEAYSTSLRDYRGGSCYDSLSPSNRDLSDPSNTYADSSSRLALYVK